MTGVTEFDQDVRLTIFRHFLDSGSRPSVAEVAAGLGADAADVEAAYRRLAEARAIVLEPGTLDIRMANPLSGVPTPFTVEVGGRSWWGNCVWDGLGVVAMLGRDGDVRTSCPDCGEPIAMSVRDGSLEPSEAVVHFAVPAIHWWDDIGYT